MNQLIGIIIGLLLGVLVSFGSLQFYGQSKSDKPLPILSELKNNTSSKTITASAESSVTAKPDIAIIQLAIENRGPKLDVLTIEINQKSALILQRLKEFGILEKDIQSRLDINPQYTSGGKGIPPRINGYEVRNAMTVKVRTISKVGDALDLMIAAGANSIDLAWSLEDDEKFKSQARSNAIRLALNKIKDMASAADVKVGDIVSLQEGYSSQQALEQTAALARVSAAPASTRVESGVIQVTAQVSIVSEIK